MQTKDRYASRGLVNDSGPVRGIHPELLAGEIDIGDVRPIDRAPFSWMHHRIDLRNGHTGDTGTSSGIALDLNPHDWFCPVHPWAMLIRIMSARGYNEAGGRSYCRVCLRAKLRKAVARVRGGLKRA